MTGAPRPHLSYLTTLMACAVVLAVAALPQALAKPKDPSPSVNGNHDPGEGSCDVDGVNVAWHTGFTPGPTTGAFRVARVTVSGINGTCSQAGAQATVRVSVADGTTPGATASTPVPVGQTSTTLVLDRAPRAEDVTHVSVELAGGRVPVPSECESMSFDHIRVGTAGDDVLSLTQRRTLVFGLGGHDDIRSGPQDDCLAGQTGNDRLQAEGGQDVLVGGDGADRLFGGEGKDVLHGGPGDDHLDGGNGKDDCYGGPGIDTFANCETVVQ